MPWTEIITGGRRPALRSGLLLVLWLVWAASAGAEVTVSLGWERPVVFKVVDAETGEVVPDPLLIVKTEKGDEGRGLSAGFYEVLTGGVNGRIPYQASAKTSGVEIRAVATGYALLTRKVSWDELPPRQQDQNGLDLGSPPEIRIALQNLARAGRWRSNFRLTIAPELDDLLDLQPPYLSPEGKRTISEFLNRERNRMLGI